MLRSRAVLFVLAAFAVSAQAGTTISSSKGFFQTFDQPQGFAGSDTYAKSVSADGDVVVGTTNSGTGNVPFIWTPAGGTQLLNPTMRGVVFDVSDNGQVVVGELYPNPLSTQIEGFRWTPGGGVQTLGHLAGGNQTAARSTSGDGSVIVGYSNGKAFRWTSGGITELPSGVSAVGRAVSPDGTFVAGGLAAGSDIEATRWNNGAPQGLGDLPGGIVQGFGEAITPNGGTVVGGSRDANGDQAFRWNSTIGMVGLGHLGSFTGGSAYGVSADASRIVGSDDALAFLWDNAHGMRELRQVLINDYNLNMTGWLLGTAYAISPNGNVIVGQAYSPATGGVAFRVVLPEPGAMVGISVLALLALRRVRGEPRA